MCSEAHCILGFIFSLTGVVLEGEICHYDNRSAVGAVGGYCFRVGVYCEWVGAIVLFVYSIVCE